MCHSASDRLAVDVSGWLLEHQEEGSREASLLRR
jgi:hypothetical protein